MAFDGNSERQLVQTLARIERKMKRMYHQTYDEQEADPGAVLDALDRVADRIAELRAPACLGDVLAWKEGLDLRVAGLRFLIRRDALPKILPASRDRYMGLDLFECVGDLLKKKYSAFDGRLICRWMDDSYYEDYDAVTFADVPWPKGVKILRPVRYQWERDPRAMKAVAYLLSIGFDRDDLEWAGNKAQGSIHRVA